MTVQRTYTNADCPELYFKHCPTEFPIYAAFPHYDYSPMS